MKKGQAALEFLTTYGWAFLVILVMIGALAYFGVLSPGRFLPSRCNVGPEFGCDEFRIDLSDGTVKIKLSNNIGETMGSFSLTKCSFGTIQADTLAEDITTVPSGGQAELTGTFNNAATDFPPVGSKGKFQFEVKYTPQGKTYEQTILGEVYGPVQS